MTMKKAALALICTLGLLLLIKNQTRYKENLTGSTDVTDPLPDPHSGIWFGLGLVFFHNIFSSQAEVLLQRSQVSIYKLRFLSQINFPMVLLCIFITYKL